ncbi:MAG TPA: aquaporin [Candidatus Bilamarchaeum sp.]|nr:aquaporin [Candidatus Bilamarchaeum sp.]
MRAYLSEFIGTFALVFIGAGSVLAQGLNGSPGLVGIALAHGIILLSMIYALASVSGAHFNPAVTISLLVNRRIEPAKAAGYVVSQLIGASVAGFALLMLFPVATSAQLYGFPQDVPLAFGIGLEAILTFFLVMAVYGTAVSKKAPEGAFGLAIGGAILADIAMGGSFTGAAMNPARAFGPALASGFWGTQLIYWAGPILGAIAASLVCEYLFMEKKK